jgi:chromosome partitioning protein
METITVTNQKGGTGKTSTALFLAYGLALRGYRVLLVDLDSQQDATYATGAAYDPTATVLEILLGEMETKAAIVPVQTKKKTKLDLLPASPQLATLDIQLFKQGQQEPEDALRASLSSLEGVYDYVVLDTPPAISMAVLSALTASQWVVVPTQADIFGLKGLGNLAKTIQTVKAKTNPELRVLGILLGRYNPRTNFTKAVTGMLQTTSKQLNTKVFSSTIREAIAVKEAQGERTNIFEYAPKAKVTQDVQAFIDEALEGMNDDGK